MSEYNRYEIKDDSPSIAGEIIVGGIAVTGLLAIGTLKLAGKAAEGMYHVIQKEMERRKKENEQRERLELERMKANFSDLKASLFSRIHTLDSGELKPYTPDSQIESIQKTLSSIEQKILNGNDLSSVQSAFEGTSALDTRLSQLENQARQRHREFLIRKEQEKKDQLTGRLDFLSAQIAEMMPSGMIRFVKKDADALVKNIKTAQSDIDKKDFDLAEKKLGQYELEFEKLKNDARQKSGILDHLNDLHQQISIILKDEIIKAWKQKEYKELQDEIIQYSTDFELIQNIPCEQLEKQYIAFKRLTDEWMRQAAADQENELARQYLVTILIQAMKDANFTVSNPKLEGGRTGNVVISGYRPGRAGKQDVTMNVGLDGVVNMDSDGGDPGDINRIREAKLDKNKEHKVACREISDQLREFVAKRGLPLKEIKRQWHNPDRIAKGARKLPGGREHGNY